MPSSPVRRTPAAAASPRERGPGSIAHPARRRVLTAGRVAAMLLVAGVAVLGTASVGAARDDRFADLPAGTSPTGAPVEPPAAHLDAVPAPRAAYPVPAGARIAAPGGRGTACTVSAPCDLPRALNGAGAGGTVVLRGGTYRTGNLRIRTRLTLQAYPGEQVWVSGSAEVGGWRREGAGWRSDPTAHCFRGRYNGVRPEDIDPKMPQAALTEMVFRDGTGLRQVASLAGLRPGTFYVDCAARVLHVGDDPAGHRIEAAVHAEGVSVAGPRAAGTVIRGVGFSGYAQTAVSVYAPRVTLERNVVVGNAISGGAVSAAEATLRGNLFAYNGRTGFRGARMHGSLLEGNVFLANNTEGFRRDWSAAGVKILQTDRLSVRGNRFEGNFSQGLWLDVSVTNALVVGNVAAHNTTIGLFYEISDRGTFAGNVAYGNGAGIMLSGASRTRVYNNTLVGNNSNLFVKDSDRRNTDRAEIAAGVTWDSYGNTVRNNLLALARGKLLTASNCGMTRPGRMIDTLDHNGYLREGTKDLATWDDGGSRCRGDYPRLAALRAGTGHERHGVELSAGDALFAGAGEHDYRLASGSPARGRGGPVPADIAAALGLPTAGPVDLGAPALRALPTAPPTPPGTPLPTVTSSAPGSQEPTTSGAPATPSGSPTVSPPPGLAAGAPLPPGAGPSASRAVPVAGASGSLPLTGSTSVPVVVAGLVLLVSGLGMAAYGRRRTPHVVPSTHRPG